MVEHNGHKAEFDWSLPEAELPNAGIRWAAFYSDCKQEVSRVYSKLPFDHQLADMCRLVVFQPDRETHMSPLRKPSRGYVRIQFCVTAG